MDFNYKITNDFNKKNYVHDAPYTSDRHTDHAMTYQN